MSDCDSDQEVKKQIIAKTPLEQRARFVALNHYLLEKKKLDKKLEAEILEINLKYQKLAEPSIQSSNDIINGKIPTQEEISKIDLYLNDNEKDQKETLLHNSNPIEDYWFKVLENSDIVGSEILEHDIPILKHLKTINVQNGEHESFTLIFEFSENPFFKNKQLKKAFILKKDEDFPEKTEGTEIEWNEGKNVTKKIVKKKQKNKKSGQSRTIEKQVDQESFFNFFKSWVDTEEKEKDEEDEEGQRFEIDYEIGKSIQEELIPYSLEYYLGIKQEEGEHDDEDDEESGSESGSESDEKEKKKSKKVHKKSGEEKGEEKKEKADCKQQ